MFNGLSYFSLIIQMAYFGGDYYDGYGGDCGACCGDGYGYGPDCVEEYGGVVQRTFIEERPVCYPQPQQVVQVVQQRPCPPQVNNTT